VSATNAANGAPPDQPPGRIELHVGEERTITLPGLGTAGYAWESQVDGPPDVVEVSHRLGSSGPETAVGASAPSMFTIRGKSPGRVTLRLVQLRPWERDQPPLNSHEIEVTVE
jgi:predicted secreted protein